MNIPQFIKDIPGLRYLKNKASGLRQHIYWWLNHIKQKRLASRIAREANADERTIKVAFILYELPFWKNEALFKAMQEDSHFTPAFWISDPFYVADEEIRKDIRNQCNEYVQKNNFLHFDDLSLEELRETFSPDFIFVFQPYSSSIPFEIKELKKELPCFIPYCYSNSEGAWLYGDRKIRYFYRYYLESSYIQGEARKYMKNKARNTRVSGLPMATWLLNTRIKRDNNDRKCIIWAPHWTVGLNENRTLNLSTFLIIGEAMLDIVKKYKDRIDFVFKPHPKLKRELYTTPGWGKERSDDYYRAWQEGENTRIEDGSYTELFAQSDAMIHDCGSFILEYLLMDKPCMYMMRPETLSQFNRSTKEALNCYEKGSTPEDIEKFIQSVLAGNDPMSAKRQAFIHSYLLPNNQSPVQNIIEDLLNP